MPTTQNGQRPLDVGAENIERAMDLCGKALIDVFEECAKRYEDAKDAENEIHNKVISQLEDRIAECRARGEESARWLRDRGATALAAVAAATGSIEALSPTSASTSEQP